MLNYIKSDIYLMSKMKVVYILPIIAFLLIFVSGFFYIKFNMGLIGVDEQLMDQVEIDAEGERDSEVFMNSFSAGFNAGMGSEEKLPEELSVSDFFSGGLMYHSSASEFAAFMYAGLTVLMLAGIFPAFFIGNWLRGGMTKNMLKSNSNRWVPFLSKCIVIFIFCLLFCLLVFIESAIVVAIFGAEFKLGIDGAFAGYFLTQVFLTFAFSMVVTLVTMLSNSSALGMVFDIICGAGLLKMGMMLIEILVNHVLFKGSNFEIPMAKYLLSSLTSSIAPGASGGEYGKTIIAGLVYVAIAVVCGGLLFKKKDIH